VSIIGVKKETAMNSGTLVSSELDENDAMLSASSPSSKISFLF
jgi:hypothetical protein